MEAEFLQIQSHKIAITANPMLNHCTYFTLVLNELAINPGHFGPLQGSLTVLMVFILIVDYVIYIDYSHVTNLRKAGVNAHNRKTHFSQSNDSCTH